VTRLNRAGSALAYSTFLGGTAPFSDEGHVIAVERGSAYVAGITGSDNYPTTAAALDTTFNGQADAFVTKLKIAGRDNHQDRRNPTALAVAGAGGTISGDGHHVVYTQDDNGDVLTDVFARDLQAHATALLSRASGASDTRGNGESQGPSPSADGRRVAFASFASNLTPDALSANLNVFVRDVETNTTTLVSRATGAAGAAANQQAINPSMSADGRYVAFVSMASNLDPATSGFEFRLYVRDLKTNTTTLASRATGAQGAAAGVVLWANLSADGRYVAFGSSTPNLTADDPDAQDDIFVRDLQANTTTLISRASGATGEKSNGSSFGAIPAISGDGRYVAFTSNASNLTSDPPSPEVGGVYVRDRIANTTTLVSRAHGATGAPANRAWFDSLAISDDGRYVTWATGATNLSPDDSADDDIDVYLRDTKTNATTLVSRASGPAGAKAVDGGSGASMSADGRYVAFYASDPNLTPEHTGGLFVRDVLGAPARPNHPPDLERGARPHPAAIAGPPLPHLTAAGRESTDPTPTWRSDRRQR
jgi:Tol biopolymer transport system component